MNDFPGNLTTQDFDYELPQELIALQPEPQRDSSRLLVVTKSKHEFTDHTFTDVINYLMPGDLLILNDTKVFPARLFGAKSTGGKIEILAERVLSENLLKAQIKSSRSPKVGNQIIINQDINAQVVGREDDFFLLEFVSDLSVLEIFERFGNIPLPPYINRQQSQQDKARYQTVYAQKSGAVAAPTAGLHFTQALLDEIEQKGVSIGMITLHVGAGTFQPVKVEDPTQHKMHAEFAHVPANICQRVLETKQRGNKVIAVGTTCVRALESAAYKREFSEYVGETEIFIYPGFNFQVIDALITNFHLPRSTLLMLISALAGREKIIAAYQHAIQQRYRFFSYGDAMLIIN